MNKKGMLVILSAPSGCGKDTVFKEILKIRTDCIESVSATTRAPRDGEVDGINYFFKSKEDFENMINNGELLEYASYNGCYYGTPVEGVNKAIENGKICFLIIEIQGAMDIMKKYNDCVSIFLLPPDMDTLVHRLNKRATDSKEMIANRVKLAENEITYAKHYKYNVVNDDLQDTVENINSILDKELLARN